MNRDLLMSSAAHYRIVYEINPYMDMSCQPDTKAALAEHEAISAAHRAAGRTVRIMESAPQCPDMVYTANGAFVCDQRALLGAPPPARQHEIPYFRAALKENGLDVYDAPYPFSGQGDALACGPFLLAGHGRRTDRRIHPILAELFGHETIPLQTTSDQWYDLDLALAVIDTHTLAYHPQALTAPSHSRLHDLGLDLIEVDAQEARAFALNLISDGTTVTMTTGAPKLAATLRDRDLTVAELDTTQLRKGGGGVRCTALTLDNPTPTPPP
ncbi:dimethylarginine dimethylaminohydrolase family protein [Streptomyces alboniger]|uniref:Amidinotransferase n=1 Tax=Streptomyces alboniger TaxID=132473 RepID=A0A5J6HCI5_STRAD|nr:amidinotransferase [Streptomyces alboniger]QEV16183.1 amidinotransferase [Streptomyces alboniger]